MNSVDQGLSRFKKKAKGKNSLRKRCTCISDIDIKILFSKVDSPEKKQLWTYNKNKTRQKWRVFKENQL